MNWTNPSHSCAATYCITLGRPCPAAQRMLNALSASMNQAKAVTEEHFEISGEASLSACEAGCMARFIASHSRIRLFCDVPKSADQTALDQFADACFGDHIHQLYPTHSTPPPRALAQAHPLEAAASPSAFEPVLQLV